MAKGGRTKLPERARIGRVRLRVADIGRVLGFYEGVLGLRAVASTTAEVELAPPGSDRSLVVLSSIPGAAPRPPRSAGLYHFALLVPTRQDLASTLAHLLDADWRLQGFADHLVSESIYLADPEGNGIELYADRPRSSWTWQGREVRMATDPLDFEGLIAEAKDPGEWRGLAGGTVIGHVHLEVTDLEKAVDFYSRVVGLDVTSRSYPGACFFSVGGYHHHLAVNVWAAASRAAPGRAQGLVDFEIVMPEVEDVEALRRRLRGSVPLSRNGYDDDRFRFEDPSGIGVVVTTGT